MRVLIAPIFQNGVKMLELENQNITNTYINKVLEKKKNIFDTKLNF